MNSKIIKNFKKFPCLTLSHVFHRVKKKFFQKQNKICNATENSIFNGTSLGSVACKMPKSIAGHGSFNILRGIVRVFRN